MRTIADMLISAGMENLTDFLYECQRDFSFFGKYVLELDVMPYHLYWVDCFLTKRRTCVVAFRGSGKTHVLGCCFPLWMAMFSKDKEFLIVAASREKAQDIVKDIRSTVENNQLLSSILLPTGVYKAWSTSELKTKTNWTIKVRAFTPKGIRGSHVDYVLADEVGEMEDQKLFFDGLIPTTTHKNGHLMAIGTYKRETDLLHTLAEPTRGYHCVVYPVLDSEGVSMWPNRFSKKKLKQLENEIGSLAFKREYMCQLVDSGVQPFKLSDIVAAYDPQIGFSGVGRYYGELEDPHRKWGDYYIGVDLAQSPQGDFSVYTVVEHLNNKIYLRNITRIRGIHYKEQEQQVRELYYFFKPLRVLVDKSVFGEVFISDLRDMSVPAEEFSFTPDNRGLILNNLMRLFENEMVVIPRLPEDGPCIDETNNLTEELQKIIYTTTNAGFRTFQSVGKHDDCVMSLALAAWAATEHGEAVDEVGAVYATQSALRDTATFSASHAPDFPSHNQPPPL